MLGISIVAFGNGLAYPNIQLLMLDLAPTRRGAVMSAVTFVTLVFNAVSAAPLAPYAGALRAGLRARGGRLCVPRLGLLAVAPGRRSPRGRLTAG